MKVSTKGRYGIHAMFDLALHDRDTPQPLKAIAERQNVPEPYLEQLVLRLRKQGLVRSVRGAQGGYMLARTPEQITVGEVLRALEGEMAMADCIGGIDSCSRAGACPSRLVWQKMQDGLNDIVDGITLKDMVNDYKRLKDEGEEHAPHLYG